MKTLKLLCGLYLLSCFFVFKYAYADEWFACIPNEIIEFRDRIHVKCSNVHIFGDTDPDDSHTTRQTIKWLAIDKVDSSKAERFVSLATTAVVCGYQFPAYISFEGTQEQERIGCKREDCRIPSAFGVRK